MGIKTIQLKLATNYSNNELRHLIGKKLGINEFTYQIANKSLDARNKSRIHWMLSVVVHSPEIKEEQSEPQQQLEIPYQKRHKKVAVVGNGPAGFFIAYVLQLAGFETVILERGSNVTQRAEGIKRFETTGQFSATNNYAFGEGGAGTFSDGKLTSRSKHINKEKAFITQTYIKAGAPEEIAYLAHPHLGSDNLKNIVQNLHKMYNKAGGLVHFNTHVQDIFVEQGHITGLKCNSFDIEADYVVFATGHSAYETYRMLMKHGVPFRTKNFALGSRVEHEQQVINQAQWGRKHLPGVKAAEYRLTHSENGKLPIFTFCMCPGGMVVPATPYKNANIVNGMSLYQRNNNFANAACVAGINLNTLLKKEVNAIEAIDWLEKYEQYFYKIASGYAAPFCSISDFLKEKQTKTSAGTSYPLGLLPLPLWDILPKEIIPSLKDGLRSFSKKLKGFETGNMLGLESKTSAPIQVLRNENGFCQGWDNLLMAGEGSGYAGGIMSSAADGIKAAFGIIAKDTGVII